ncbi:MAG: DUF1700 domain-containing protein [Defluviitaleaceae bacterium]|nr:DUF1700 domain-containing protein [Defluviitaleaceae bacterium]MCL2275506.1 DUF1700 domain-containing protein [Defluviitaleaceae bacterium]
MTKTQFLDQLDYKLRVLPLSERRDALDYYEGYINDANGEENAIAQLGTPGEVAANILAEYVAKAPSRRDEPEHRVGFTGRKKHKLAWALIIAFFALPVGLPFIIAAGATAFGLFIALCSIVFSLWVTGGAFILAGIVTLFSAVFVFFQGAGFGVMVAGIGFMSLGLGIWSIRFAMWCTGGFTWITRYVARKIRNRNEGSAVYAEPQRLQ